MTTGSWFVFFKAQQCPHCERIYPEFVKLSQDEELSENGIVLATMDVPSNRATATRFDIRYAKRVLFEWFYCIYILTTLSLDTTRAVAFHRFSTFTRETCTPLKENEMPKLGNTS